MSQVFAQDLYDHKLNKEKWSEIKDGIRYENGQKGKQAEWTTERQNGNGKGNGNGNGGNGNGSNSGSANGEHSMPRSSSSWNPKINPGAIHGLSYIGWIILGIFILALIYFIVRAILNRNVGNKKVNPVDYFDDEVPPSEIPLTELQKRLKEALDAEDYRAAVRIYYLFILKDLSTKNWINWQREKTNMHYLYEMQSKSYFNEFNQTVNYFEIIWYGKRKINQVQFKTIQPSFTDLLDKLGVK